MDAELDNKINQVAAMLGHKEVPDNIKEMISAFAAKHAESSAAVEQDSEENHVAGTEQASMEAQYASAEQYANADAISLSDEEHNSKNKDAIPPLFSTNKEEVDQLALFAKIKQLTAHTQEPDPKVTLLRALEPFMSDAKQAKLQHCKKIFQMTKLTSLLKEIDL